MIDWSQPQPLSRVTEGAGFTMSDVAFSPAWMRARSPGCGMIRDGLIASAVAHCNPWPLRFPESPNISPLIPCWPEGMDW
jgi:hypothetical protein